MWSSPNSLISAARAFAVIHEGSYIGGTCDKHGILVTLLSVSVGCKEKVVGLFACFAVDREEVIAYALLIVARRAVWMFVDYRTLVRWDHLVILPLIISAWAATKNVSIVTALLVIVGESPFFCSWQAHLVYDSVGDSCSICSFNGIVLVKDMNGFRLAIAQASLR